MKKAAVLMILLALPLPVLHGQPPPPPPGAEAVTAQPVTTIWAKLGISCDKMRKCYRECCETPLGQFINGMLTPVRFASGGLLPDCCAKPLTRDELAALLPGEISPGEAAAAKIKASEAGAKARRAAIRYLGTVDCNWYPEAEAALIAGLRSDQNECVRLEAAIALGNGCCCTKNTIEKLQIAANGSDEDGNPPENSERVKLAAWASLQSCLSRGIQMAPGQMPEPPEKGVFPPEPTPTPKVVPPEAFPPLPSLGFPISQKPAPAPLQLLGASAAALPRATPTERAFAETASVRPQTMSIPTGSRNLFSVWSRSRFQQVEMPSPPPEATDTSAPRSVPAVSSSLRSLGLTPLGAIPLQ